MLRERGTALFVGTTMAALGRLILRGVATSAGGSLRGSGGAVVGGVHDSWLDAATVADRKKSGLYTKSGDKGQSSLYNGERRAKTDGVFEALGHQDELNCAIGVAREHCAASANGLDAYLVEIQSRLFDLGAAVATPVASSSSDKLQYTAFPAGLTSQLEQWIDALDGALPPLTNFVIPSGGLSCTHLNLARATCRRAERAVVPLVLSGHVDAECGRYLNRLSDFLFAASRSAAFREGRQELLWKKAT